MKNLHRVCIEHRLELVWRDVRVDQLEVAECPTCGPVEGWYVTEDAKVVAVGTVGVEGRRMPQEWVSGICICGEKMTYLGHCKEVCRACGYFQSCVD